MTATNHALTGAVIGLVVASPLALPLAFLSHYVLDALPHYGWPEPEKKRLKSDTFRNYLIVEAIVCFIIVFVLFISQPGNWVLAALCAFLAAMPDFFSFNRYRNTRKSLPHQPNTYERFASKIQWFERPIGAVVEVAWLIGMGTILAIYL